jgi:hypothetical protein
MERRKLPHAAYVFRPPEMTPQDTPEELTPTPSQIDSPALSPTTAAPDMVAEPQIDEVACSVDEMAMISRFFHLLDRSKALVYVHGPYTNYAGTTVLSRLWRYATHPNGFRQKTSRYLLPPPRIAPVAPKSKGPQKTTSSCSKNYGTQQSQYLK